MTTADLARAFADALKAGDFQKAESFWSDDIASFETDASPRRELRGREAVQAKGEWWMANHEMHAFETQGPFVNGDQFALIFRMDVTQKASGQRVRMEEVGLYSVRDGKISEERFFY